MKITRMKRYAQISDGKDYSICKKFKCRVPNLRLYLIKRVGLDHEEKDVMLGEAHSDSVHRKLSFIFVEYLSRIPKLKSRRKRRTKTHYYESNESL
jgi:hypothetical protein